MTVKWFAGDVIRETNRVMAKVEKEIAEDVRDDAKKILKRNAKKKVGDQKKIYGTSIGGLLDQFSIKKSKFKNGGYLVWCQGPNNWRPPYHASFLELGTYKDEAQPFMRPAAKKNQRKAKRKFQEALDKI